MKVLAVGAHPDDLEIAAGGTLSLYAARGDEVTVCHVANGDMGHVIIMPEELSAIRREEARAGGRHMGAKEVISLEVRDVHIQSDDLGLVRAMVEVVRHAQPDIIITHDPEDYMKDHVEASKLVFDASFISTMPHYETKSPFFPPFPPLYYMDTLAGLNFIPEQYVDISAVIEQKLEALACHESQIKWMLDHDHIDFIDFVRVNSCYRGNQANATYAEGFRTCKTWPRMTCTRLLP